MSNNTKFRAISTISSSIKTNHNNNNPSSTTNAASIYTLLTSKSKTLQQIHALIIHKGLEQDPYLISKFISLSKSYTYSSSIFNRITNPTTILYNSLLHVSSPHPHHTFSLFLRMKLHDPLLLDSYTFLPMITVCANECWFYTGQAVHGSSLKYGVDKDLYVSTKFIHFYDKCGYILYARKVFDQMTVRNVVSWTTIVVAYAGGGDMVEAKRLFDLMPVRNIASYNALITGFAKSGDMVNARKLFDAMVKKDVVSYTSMLDGYAKMGDMDSAKFLFEQTPNKDIVAWSALINGYGQNGQPDKALEIFDRMSQQNVKLDEYVMVHLMSACSQVGRLDLAERVESYLSKSNIDISKHRVLTALIDMNAKCGNIDRAMFLFESIPKKDVYSCSSVIQGLSIHGRGEQAVSFFDKMLCEGLVPDKAAFTVILTACSRSKLVEEGWHFFDIMKNKYKIDPSPVHYACMVDLLGRSGQLRTGYELIKSMPVQPDLCAWGALLGACKLHGDSELAGLVANKLFELEPQNAGNYVLLSNIYAAEGRWLDVDLLRNKMKERGVQKIPGRSWI
ncbi:hypothetical protein ACFE04_018196 [Oxalis oulophora]